MTHFAEAHNLFAHLDGVTEVTTLEKGPLPLYMRVHRERLRRRCLIMNYLNLSCFGLCRGRTSNRLRGI
ncbi:MAG: hypothetical protein ACJAUW_000484 [Yoonia sp.]|jgi:hypothetical protein